MQVFLFIFISFQVGSSTHVELQDLAWLKKFSTNWARLFTFSALGLPATGGLTGCCLIFLMGLAPSRSSASSTGGAGMPFLRAILCRQAQVTIIFAATSGLWCR